MSLKIHQISDLQKTPIPTMFGFKFEHRHIPKENKKEL